MTISFATQNAEYILKHANGFKPKFGLILGSGLGILADEIESSIDIPYRDLQGFGGADVAGHKGTLTLGYLKGVPVACLQGRGHYYEGLDHATMRTPIYTLKAIGCESLVITNAAASLRAEVTPGNLVLIEDHINFAFNNPLAGSNQDEFGPRFPEMNDPYDLAMREQMLVIADQLGISLNTGVYIGVLGPSYETKAEIRAFRTLGADLVGMSTVPEVIVARHCGLKVMAISSVTNMACGMSDEILSHKNVLKIANQAASNLILLISRYMENVSEVA